MVLVNGFTLFVQRSLDNSSLVLDQLIRDDYGDDASVSNVGEKGKCCDVHDAC